MANAKAARPVSALAGLAVMLAACAPRPVESFGPAASASGNPAYWAQGYTRPGQLTRDFAEGYAESFARQVCPGDYRLVRVDINRAQNAFDRFLHWQAIVECTDAAAPSPAETAPQPAPPSPAEGAPLELDPGGAPSAPLPLSPTA